MYFKSEIICPIHGSFLQNPADHIKNKYGCRKCADLITKSHRLKYDQKTFIEKVCDQ
jgi:DNA-directed RNA polymerase subunit M/transcription elongation factor TFIIS